MQKTTYEDYKYGMQDTTRVYVGCKFTFQELLDSDEVLFKFRMVVQKYIVPEADLEDTLETHLYYLDSKSFLVKLYEQMRGRIKINIIEEKKTLFGKTKREYVTRQLTIKELVQMTPEEKEARGVVIQELSVSKLALMAI